MSMYQTPFRKTSEGTYLRATFGLRAIGSQAPYMSVTAEEHTRTTRLTDRSCISCGCLHSDVLAVFPELAPLVRWHLATAGEPMHYIANTRYWWRIAKGLDERAPEQYERDRAPRALAACAMLGNLPSDPTVERLLEPRWNAVERWLRLRMPAMREAYAAAVAIIPGIAAALDASEVAS